MILPLQLSDMLTISDSLKHIGHRVQVYMSIGEGGEGGVLKSDGHKYYVNVPPLMTF